MVAVAAGRRVAVAGGLIVAVAKIFVGDAIRVAVGFGGWVSSCASLVFSWLVAGKSAGAWVRVGIFVESTGVGVWVFGIHVGSFVQVEYGSAAVDPAERSVAV